MKNFIFFFTLALFATTSFAQVFWSENFESTTPTAQYTLSGGSVTPFTNDVNSYFNRVQDASVNGGGTSSLDYTGEGGLYFFAAEDIDKVGGTQNAQSALQHVLFSGINISGKSDIRFSGMFAASDGTPFDYQGAAGTANQYIDYMIVDYKVDAGPWVNLVVFLPNSNGTSGTTNNKLDRKTTGITPTLTDSFSASGGTPLTSTFATHTADFTVSGTTLQIRCKIRSNGGAEEMAFDDFSLEVVTPSCTNPTIGTNPTAKTACGGSGAVSFAVAATGTALTYQWQEDNVDITNGGVYSNATTNTLTLTGAGTGLDGKAYRCVVKSSGACPVNSSAATLSVLNISTPGVPNAASLSREATHECLDANSWTHYVDKANNEIILSVKKNGNNIGTINDGTFHVYAYTNGTWSNSSAQAITAPYVSSANPWYVMKRYWDVVQTSQPTTDVSVRSYYTSNDLAGLNAMIDPDITRTQLRFYKINGSGNNPNPSAGHSGITKAASYSADGYWEYANGTATTSTWLDGTIGSHFYAEMVIRFFSGGGGGGSVGGGSAFPVEWAGISARQVNDQVVVNWSTASELNSGHFTLQRAADGETFSDLGTVAAVGNSSTPQQYELSDPMPLTGRNVYRVQETGIDGAVSHSATVEVSFASVVSVGTNGNSLVIRGAAAGDRFFLYDMAGRLVRDLSLTSANQTVSVSESGIYCWRLQGSNAPLTGKVLLQN